MTNRSGWIGVDFDRTLATYEHGQYPHCGEPIQPMVDRVKLWLADGWDVRIVTARVSDVVRYSRPNNDNDWKIDLDQRERLHKWCLEHLGQELTITNSKDFHMICLYDDRAVAVEPNTGRLLSPEFVLEEQ